MSSKEDFKAKFSNERDIKIKAVENRLQEILATRYPQKIYEAMAYSVFAGGKRLRPLLLLAAYEAIAGNQNRANSECALEFACAIEMIHTYSMIHDDLPVMDNDDLRRGKPTCHKVYGDAMALLAGDGLLNMAYEQMSGAVVKNMAVAAAMKVIAEAAGANGMIGGQVVDIESEGLEINAETLNYIHVHKTAALIGAALTAGAILGGAPQERLRHIAEGGRNLGVAFQIKDDILDVTSTEEQLGKTIGSDAKNQKTTYLTFYGLDRANQDYERMSREAINLIVKAVEGGETEFLAELLAVLTARES